MKRRWYGIARIVGDGSDNDPFRCRLADIGIDHVAAYAPPNPDGTPSLPVCFVSANVEDLIDVPKDVELDALPVHDLDQDVASLQLTTRNAIRDVAEKHGQTIPSRLNDLKVRDVVHWLGTKTAARFDIDRDRASF